MAAEFRRAGLIPYPEALESMKRFTDQRDAGTRDEIWLLQHPSVYTLGLSGRTEHVLHPGGIPVIHSDRGGQVTYHGPGQLICYVLLDLRRAGLTLRGLVHGLEEAVIRLLDNQGIESHRQPGAPGVYTDRGKIASLGLRIRRGCSYHGLALNVNMDLAPFRGINPCGFPGLEVTHLSAFGCRLDCDAAADLMENALTSVLPIRHGTRAPAGGMARPQAGAPEVSAHVR